MQASERFRRNLKLAMEARDVTQNDLAVAIGSSQPYVNRVLKGNTKPSVDQCEEMAKAVHYPLDALLGSTEIFSEAVLTVNT